MAIKGWPKRLKWSDFKKLSTRPPGYKEGIVAWTEVRYGNPPGKKFKMVKGSKGFSLSNINFIVYLDKKKSWVIKGRKTAELLKHEQGHYDIGGLLVRELHQKLAALSEKTQKQLNKRFKEIDQEIKKKMIKINKRYDSEAETNHGTNKKNQQKWDNLLKSCIADKTKHLPD